MVTSVGPHGQPVGTTANAVSSLSLDPPLILVCFDRASLTLEAIRSHGAFVVNVLAAPQRELAANFARRGPRRSGRAWGTGRARPAAPGWRGCSPRWSAPWSTARPGATTRSLSGASGTRRLRLMTPPRCSSGAAPTPPSTGHKHPHPTSHRGGRLRRPHLEGGDGQRDGEYKQRRHFPDCQEVAGEGADDHVCHRSRQQSGADPHDHQGRQAYGQGPGGRAGRRTAAGGAGGAGAGSAQALLVILEPGAEPRERAEARAAGPLTRATIRAMSSPCWVGRCGLASSRSASVSTSSPARPRAR